MPTFAFTAVCGEQSLPLEVKLDYRPGKQSQRARRIAVGHLLALLDTTQAAVDASSDELIKVSADGRVWVIGEARALAEGRGKL